MPYYVYILQCADGTYYVGITNDIAKRILVHNNSVVGAKYTRGRRPVKLVFREEYATKSEALKREYEIKTWTRNKKSNFINKPTSLGSRHPEFISGSTPKFDKMLKQVQHDGTSGPTPPPSFRPPGRNPLAASPWPPQVTTGRRDSGQAETKTNKTTPEPISLRAQTGHKPASEILGGVMSKQSHEPALDSRLSTLDSFSIIIRVNKRAKRIRLTVYPDLRVVVTIPRPTSEKYIQSFVSEKSEWIQKQLKLFAKSNPAGRKVDDKKSYKVYKESALRLVERRIDHFNKYYKFGFNGLRITNTKSQWGSCSARKVLSFNYRIAFILPEQADYLIVHELCHLKEFNHSQRFWRLVAETIPNYKAARDQLKKEGFSLY